MRIAKLTKQGKISINPLIKGADRKRVTCQFSRQTERKVFQGSRQ